MSYRIRRITQPPNTHWCLPTCAAMIANTFKLDISLKEMVSKLKTTKKGTKYSITAATLSKMGLKVIYQLQWEKMPVDFILTDSNNEEFVKHIQTNDWDYYKRMFDAGVKIIPRHPSTFQISKMIKRGFIPIVDVNAGIFYKTKTLTDVSHAIIIKRIDHKRKRVFVIDPNNTVKTCSIEHLEISRRHESVSLFVKK